MANRNTNNELPVGTVLRSPENTYSIESVLGSGGFGITYKVSADVMHGNIPIHTYFAMKEHYMSDCCEREHGTQVNVSKPQQDSYRDSLADFKSEATRLNQLSGKHSGIVRVNEVFQANNTAYYVMEYLNGDSLRKEVKKHGPYAEAEALAIIGETADAVAFLHGERITHLDIKPDNIIMHHTRSGGDAHPVLIDFGLAKHYDKKGNATSTIRTQGCSDGYAPVEQYVRIDSFSPTADVYALGATLFFLLTGKDPLVATDINKEYIAKSLPANVSERTRQAILAAMKRDRGERTATAEQFLQDIGYSEIRQERAAEVAVAPSSHVTRLASIRKRLKKRWLFLTAGAAALVLLLWLVISQWPEPDVETITVNGVSFNMIRVEGGTFMMGATGEQGSDADSDEKPAHQVTLSTYYIGETEVTQALWETVMGSNPSDEKGANHPVDNVSWDDCQTFIEKLNALTGRRFRLPTEAEWEFAARGGNKSCSYKFSGSNNIDDVAWYGGNTTVDMGSCEVKLKRANELGIYDMSGNVWEWCQDWYEDYSSSSETNPTGPSGGLFRVNRGGSLDGDAEDCRVSVRSNSEPSFKDIDYGLRLALQSITAGEEQTAQPVRVPTEDAEIAGAGKTPEEIQMLR